MTAFGSLLRQLMDFTGAKLYAVAEEAGYDLSYISKWCNQDLLPAPKTAHSVGKTLGAYFAGIIRSEGREEDFFAAFPSTPSGQTLELKISRLLLEAYGASAHRKAPPEKSGGAELLTQRHEILARLRDLAASRRESGGEVVCTVDLLTVLKSRDLFVLDQPGGKGELHFHAAVDLARFACAPEENLRLLYDFLSRHREVFVTLYDGAGLAGEGILAARDGGAVMTALGPEGEIDALVHAESGPAAAQLFGAALARLKERPLLLAPARPEDMNRDGYRTDFYSRDRYKFFSPYGFEFLLPQSACESIVAAGITSAPDSSAEGVLRRLFITWDEVFEKRRIDFYLLKSAVLRYLETGELLFADILYRMSPAQRLSHLEKVKELVTKNPGIRFILLDDDGLSPEAFPAFSVYLNPKKLFLKSPPAYRTGRGPLFYTVPGEALIHAAGSFLDALAEKPGSGVYDHRNVSELEARYGGMLRRMLTLTNE